MGTIQDTGTFTVRGEQHFPLRSRSQRSAPHRSSPRHQNQVSRQIYRQKHDAQVKPQ